MIKFKKEMEDKAKSYHKWRLNYKVPIENRLNENLRGKEEMLNSKQYEKGNRVRKSEMVDKGEITHV